MFDDVTMVLTDDPPLYRDLMRLKPDELTPNGWAVKAGVSRTVWNDMRRHGNPSRRTLERLLDAAGSSLAEFEALRLGEAPRPSEPQEGKQGLADRGGGNWRAAPLPPLPLFETQAVELRIANRPVEACRIDFSKTRGEVARPTSLAADREAYAVVNAGSAMWPRFRAGRTLIVSPAARARVGDDVLVRLIGFGANRGVTALIGEFSGSAAQSLKLRQFHPEMLFDLVTGRVEAVHKILGEAI